MVDILPCELTWAPECPEPQACYSGYIFRLEEEGNDEYLRRGHYQVPHYARGAYGQAFGPLALDQMMQFCHLLGEKIARHGWVVIATEPDDLPARANAAVLLGAYLLLRKDWSLAQVCRALAEEHHVGFPCAWYGRTKKQVSPAEASADAVMEVGDCWAGIEMAKKLGWVAGDAVLSDQTLTALACSQYRRMAIQYDAAWLEPGHVLVAADPTTTIRDPNPETCKALAPVAGPTVAPSAWDEFERPVRMAQAVQTKQMAMVKDLHGPTPKLHLPSGFAGDDASDKTPSQVHAADVPLLSGSGTDISDAETRCMGPTPQQEAPLDGDSDTVSQGNMWDSVGRQGTPMPGVNVDDSTSAHTVCKLQAVPEEEHRPSSNTHRPAKDFLSFMEECGVKTILRVNRGNETGIMEFGGSYDAQVFRNHGIKQLDVPVDDKHGGVPTPSDISRAVHGCERHLGSLTGGRGSHDAVLVHCKGGFGRSIVFACCLLCWEHNLPGRSLLGWVRIMRPGAICTPDQEKFLCRLRGRDDLRRYIADSRHANACCVVS